MNEKLYDCLLDIDIDPGEIIGTLTKKNDEANAIVDRIITMSEEDHKLDCSKENCKGLDGAVIRNLKAVLVSHEEYTEDLVLGIIAGVFLYLGALIKDREFSDESNDDIVSKLESMFGKGNVVMSKKPPPGIFDAKEDEDDGKF